MNGVEGILDITIHGLFALIIAWMLCIRERKLEIFALSLLPVLMDSDHLLPLYYEGIKAFHSIFFIYAVSGSILAYGYLRDSDKARRLGAVSFAILSFSMMLDLIEGGRIAFMYPLSSQAYALPYFGAYQASKVAVLGVMVFVIGIVYYYELSVEGIKPFLPDRKKFPNISIFIQNLRFSPDVGTESGLKISLVATIIGGIYAAILISL